jgi:Zn ribbon nucleic-acid-binding protein
MSAEQVYDGVAVCPVCQSTDTVVRQGHWKVMRETDGRTWLDVETDERPEIHALRCARCGFTGIVVKHDVAEGAPSDNRSDADSITGSAGIV